MVSRLRIVGALVAVALLGTVVVWGVMSHEPITAADVRAATVDFAGDLRASGYTVGDQDGVRRNDEIEVVTAVGNCRVKLVQDIRLRVEYKAFDVPARNGRKIQPYVMQGVYNAKSDTTAMPVVGVLVSPTATDAQRYMQKWPKTFTCASA